MRLTSNAGLLPVCIDILSGWPLVGEHRVGASILVARLLCHFVGGGWPQGLASGARFGRETRRTAADATSLLAER